jgi:hypothetical protein
VDTSSIGILGDNSAEQEAVAELEAAEAAAAARAAKKGIHVHSDAHVQPHFFIVIFYWQKS